MGKRHKKIDDFDKCDEPDSSTGVTNIGINQQTPQQESRFTKLVSKEEKLREEKSPHKTVSDKSNTEDQNKAKKNNVSAQEDYDFIKFHINLIPPEFLVDSNQLQDDDDSSENEFMRKQQPVSKKLKASSGQEKSKVNNLTKSLGEDNQSTKETYSKIKEKMKHKKNSKKNKKQSKQNESTDKDRRQMLREKLLARIEELKGKRKLTSDEVVEKKRLRRKQSKLKLKMRRSDEKNKGNMSKPNGNCDIQDKKPPPVTPVKDKSGKMVFSKFDFVDSADRDIKQSDFKGKDFKRLLEKVEKKKEKLEKLKEKNPEAAKAAVNKDAWKKVLLKAEGEKIKDDPSLLKKSLKKKEKVKEKRKKKWDERQTQTENRMKAKQEKRQKNIVSRKQAKVDKKIKRAKKKGRMVPGF